MNGRPDMKRHAIQNQPNKRLTGSVACLVLLSLFVAGSVACGQETLRQPLKASDIRPMAPDQQRVFRLESESTLAERMAREAKQGINPLQLRYQYVAPTYPPVPPPEALLPRTWEGLPEIVEPNYLCYRRLYFEQLNAERYGWNLGPLHPLISAGVFYFDLAILPYQAATDPFRRYDCNTGYALPGDRMPLLLYHPPLNLPGLAAEAAAIGLMFVIFP
jgi:hypothetical protein